MSGPEDYPVGRNTRLFCKVQSALDKSCDITVTVSGVEDTSGHIAASDGFKVDQGGFTVTPVHTSDIRLESQESRDILGTTPGPRGPHPWKYNDYFRPHGTAGTAPDIDPILQSAFDKATLAAFTITEVTDEKTFKGTTGILTAGDVIGVPINATSTQIEAAVVKSVTTALGVDTVVLENDLSFEPIVGTVIAASIQYSPMNEVDEDLFVTIKTTDGAEAGSLVGCIANSLSVSASRGDQCRMEILGLARHHSGFTRAALGAGLTDAATTMTINPYIAGWGTEEDAPEFVKIDDEIMKIVSEISDAGVCTVERGQKTTAAAAHSSGADVEYWSVEPSCNGVPISGVLNKLALNGTYYGVDEAKFSTIENVFAHENAGSDKVQMFVFDRKREVKVEFTMTGYYTDFLFIGSSVGRVSVRLMMQFGNQQGKTFAVHCPEVLFTVPEVPAGLEGKITLPLVSLAVKDSTDAGISFQFAII